MVEAVDNQELSKSIERNDFLKIFAIVIMLIDHIGAILYPQYRELRIIGRLAFPVFAYFIVVGYQMTSNLNNYLFRLFVFALVSQLPYSLAFHTTRLNIFFTLFLGLYVLSSFAKKKYIEVAFVLLISGVINQWLIKFDYGTYGIILILIFYIFRDKRVNLWISLIILNIVYITMMGMSDLQFFSIFSLLFISNHKSVLNLNKYFFYIFYPLHLAILYIINIYR